MIDEKWFSEQEARIPKGEVRTRFAPSPTGYMHVGNLRTALYTWLIARHNKGKFILRIEDTDQERLVEGAVDVIYRTLTECGLDHDEGPDIGGPVGPYVQTERRGLYGKYAELLVEKGCAYRCFCEKSDADDHLMGITHVVRGSEYLSSSPKYNLLYESFGWPIPCYVHCSPVMRDAHNKMSKRHGDPSYEDLIAQGYLTDAVVNYVALLGWSPGGEREVYTMNELAEIFELKGLSKSPAIFDIEKLKFFNAEYIRAMSPEDFAKAAEPFIRQAVKNPDIDPAAIAALLQQRTEVLTDIPEKLDFFDTLPEYDTALFVHKKSKTDEAGSLEMLKAMLPVFEAIDDWCDENILAAMTDMAARCECKNAKVMWPVRIAAAGKAVTPGGAVEICRILGKAETLRRMNIAIEKLEKAVG